MKLFLMRGEGGRCGTRSKSLKLMLCHRPPVSHQGTGEEDGTSKCDPRRAAAGTVRLTSPAAAAAEQQPAATAAAAAAEQHSGTSSCL